MPGKKVNIVLNISEKMLRERPGEVYRRLIELIDFPPLPSFVMVRQISINILDEDAEHELTNSEKILQEIRALRDSTQECERRYERLSEAIAHLAFAVSKQERQKGIEYLKTKLKDKEKVVIVDPYLFELDEQQIEELVDLVKDKQETIIYRIKKKQDVEDTLKEKIPSINIRDASKEIHDRVWLWFEGDEPQGVAVGTSFNGLGKHFTYILDLPPEDAKAFWDALKALKV
jgi:vacuolar-type H+-ATPase subunit I/STV1